MFIIKQYPALFSSRFVKRQTPLIKPSLFTLHLPCKFIEHAHTYVSAKANPPEGCHLLAGVSQVPRNPDRDCDHVAIHEELLLLGGVRTALDEVRVLYRPISM